MTHPSWIEKVRPKIVYALWQGEDVGTIARRHRIDRDEVRAVAQGAALELIDRRGREVAREGAGWCSVLVQGRVYERARRLPNGDVSLINGGPSAGRAVVPWSSVEAYAPLVRYGQRMSRGRWIVVGTGAAA